jgi:hypothetical protein
MKNIPKKIYLQIGEDCDCEDWNDVYPSHEVTWCGDKINDNDIEYGLLGDNRREIGYIDLFSCLRATFDILPSENEMDEFKKQLKDKGHVICYTYLC